MTPPEILASMQLMCEQSLSPEKFEMWMEVRKWLVTTRTDLAGEEISPEY